MHIKRRWIAIPLLTAVVGIAAAQKTPEPPPPAQQAPVAKQATPEEVRKEVEEAAQAISAYTLARRNEALQRAKTAGERIDQRMQRLQSDWDQRVERMNSAARERNERLMADLRQQRQDLTAWYGDMQNSSAEAWDQARTGFVRSYRELAEAMRKLRAEYDQAREKTAKEPEEPEERK